MKLLILKIFFFVASIENALGTVRSSCTLYSSSGPQYTCKLTSVNMTSENEAIENLDSFSEIRQFVTRIETDGILSFIPVGLFSFFNNVRTVNFNSNSNVQQISTNSFKNGTKIETIYVWGHQTTNLPAFAFEDCANLVSLRIENGIISSVDDRALHGLENLKTLSFYYNQLTSVENFPVLPKLENLNLQINKLTSLPHNFFSSYPNLISLQLGSNEIKTLETFPNLPKLQTLNLQSIKISELPVNFFESIPSLQVLYLDNNQLSNLIITVPLLKLQTLKLSSNKFTSIPQSLFTQIPNVVTLSLANNELKTLDNFPTLTKLQSLHLQNIKVEQVPESFFFLISSVTNLNLDSNLLSSFYIPTTLFKLQTLQLNSNKFKEIPSSFVQLPNLRNLYMQGNNFAGLQESEVFPNVPLLQTLELSSCQISKAPKNFFSNLPVLNSLSLGSNKLTSFEINTSLLNLRSLTLRSNPITETPSNFLSTTPNITFLNMDYAQLTTLKVFSNLNQIQSIWLDNNKISSIQPNFFSSHPKLTSIDLAGNPCINQRLRATATATLEEIAKPFTQTCYGNWNGGIPDTTTTSTTSTTTTRTTTTTTTTPTTRTTTSTTTSRPLPVNNCKFTNHPQHGYTCTLSGITFNNYSGEFYLAGQHLTGKSNDDVVSVVFLRSTLEKVPRVVIDQFPNLNFLDISHSQMTKADGNTLEVCGKLKNLDASGNDFSMIREGFLSSCKNLKNAWIENNLIFSISPWNNLIKDAKSIKNLSFLDNPCVDDVFSNIHISEEYELNLSRPLRECFENFLSGAVAPRALRARTRSEIIEKKIRILD